MPEERDGVVLMLQERTIAHKMDRQLTHQGAARSVSALGAMLAHEIKNPLSGIRGAAQLLESSISDSDRELTRLICDEADRIVKLVDRMEAFTDERPVERESVNMHAVLDHVKRIAQAGFARHIRFQENYDPSLPPVFANRDQLIQVFLNLVKNAAEAIGEEAIDGEIELSQRISPGSSAQNRKLTASGEPAARILRPRQWARRAAADSPAPVRPVRHNQGVRNWPRTCTRGEDHRRPRRHS